MQIHNLCLKNFRCFDSLSVNFTSGINILTGKNAVGKTSILEAINYLSLTKSFRGAVNKELIKYNSDYALIIAEIAKNNSISKINIMVLDEEKKILVNEKVIKRIFDLNNIVNVITFSPLDVNIFRGSPKERRLYLDLNISKIYQEYGNLLVKFNDLLKNRNELLKDDKFDNNLLDVLTDQLIKVQKNIIEFRIDFISQINKLISRVVKEIKGDNDDVFLMYFPFCSLNDYENQAKKIYQESLSTDIKHKCTSNGVHREDFILKLNNKDVSECGSQGENRLLAIALKLIPYFLVKEENNHPIIVLDDVLSELDKDHQTKLIKFLRKFEQVFISTTKFYEENVNIYEVNNKQIKRRK